MKSFYEILGVPRNASRREIRHAFLRLAQQHHPDLADDDQADQQFKSIRRVYEVLSDPIRRAAYDETPGLFPLEEKPSAWNAPGAIVTQARNEPDDGRKCSAASRHHVFQVNWQRKRRLREQLLPAAVCLAGIVVAASAFAYFPTLRPPAGPDYPGLSTVQARLPQTDALKARGAHAPGSHESAESAPRSSDRLRQGSSSNSESATNPTADSAADMKKHEPAPNDLLGWKLLPSLQAEFLFDDAQPLLLPQEEQVFLLPAGEPNELLIPDVATDEVILLPVEHEASLQEYDEELLLRGPNGWEPTYQELRNTPLPDLGESEPWQAPDKIGHNIGQSLGTTTMPQRITMPHGNPSYSPAGSFFPPNETIPNHAIQKLRYVERPDNRVATIQRAEFPMNLSRAPTPGLQSVPAASTSPVLATQGIPVTGVHQHSLGPNVPPPFSPVESKHLPYQPFSPRLPAGKAGSGIGYGY